MQKCPGPRLKVSLGWRGRCPRCLATWAFSPFSGASIEGGHSAHRTMYQVSRLQELRAARLSALVSSATERMVFSPQHL